MEKRLTPAERRLVGAHTRALAQTKQSTVVRLDALWRELREYRDGDAARFAPQAARIVNAGQTQAASLRSAFVARAIRTNVVQLRPETVTGAAVRGGVDPEAVYRRPFETLWSELANGLRLEDAVARAQQRLDVLAQTDIQLASRAAAVEFAKQSAEATGRIGGWMRVPAGEACDFCLLASTQRYNTEELAPLHNLCSCDVFPLDERASREQVINRDALDQLKERGVVIYRGNGEVELYGPDPRGRSSEDEEAKETTLAAMTVQEHGELGPVLVDPRQQFTGPDDLSERRAA